MKKGKNKNNTVSKSSKASKTIVPTNIDAVTEDNAPGARFVKDNRWAKVFIPTITHAFYTTREPFLDWAPESEAFIATVQHVFNLSFPNVNYTISAGNRVVLTVCPSFLPLYVHVRSLTNIYTSGL
jgi:hypothetical protein